MKVSRGFACIDMNSSTMIAEKLGNPRYSELIRECFALLDQVLEAYPHYQVYQYVGDEAIITWEIEKAHAADALAIFRGFETELDLKSEGFRSRFGLVPSFKCAIHSGEVMESELGAKRPHKAYHGDVLNMASRILALCHPYGTSLLLSQEYRSLISNQELADMTAIEHEFINGRSRKMRLYRPKDLIKNIYA